MSAPVLTTAWIIPASIMRTMTVAIFATVLAPEKVATIRAVRIAGHGGEHVGRLPQRAAAEGRPRHGAHEVVEGVDLEGIERGEGLEVVLAAVGEAAHDGGAAVRVVRIGHGRAYSRRAPRSRSLSLPPAKPRAHSASNPP